MSEPMPTKEGDAVISHTSVIPSRYNIWLVVEDGQQEPHHLVSSNVASELGDAYHQARALGGDVFLLHQPSLEWTLLSEPPTAIPVEGRDGQ